ncbi:InlB B-repeat-containing protein [Mycoplasma phocimorsus]|uniref:InlB B-repeat-containing protein n=1 Tax=Mycoplasma phocimorsus TaxID=3045839 RepID=UPI0024BF7822|nr:InlB B-repeat-containing protein [Mycoplasma phocimorsus]MDJ1648796.1 InlB B-repeat-containing protein [Mycoplasma phocimorsus]
MNKNKILLVFSSLSIITLPLSVISCSQNIEEYILNNIELNNEQVVIYETLADFSTNSHLKITNSKFFKENDISLTLGKTNIDYKKETAEIKIIYRTKNDNTRREITLFKSFYDFKQIDVKDLRRIFQIAAKHTQIEWFGNGKYLLSNKYANISDIQFSPSDPKMPKVEDFSYKLQLINSSKVTGDDEDITFEGRFSGGKIINKTEIRVLFKYPEDDDLLVKSIDGVFTKPKVDPTKENHIFIGWSTTENATKPDLFLDDNKQIFEDQSIIYPIFQSYAILLLEVPNLKTNTFDIFKLVLNKQGIVSKEAIITFINANIPEPKDKWSYNADNLKYIDPENEIMSFSYDSESLTTNKFEIGKVYKIIPNFKHAPLIKFIDEETKKVISAQFANEKILEESKIYLTPKAEIDFDSFFKIGKNLNELVYEQTQEQYQEDQSIELNEDNIIINVIVKFNNAPIIKIDATNLNNKLVNDFVYLTDDWKIKENSLPKIDYSWYKGEDKRIYKPYDNVPNNKLFDKRTEAENAIGYFFDGWYLDANFKIPLKFKNGVSIENVKNKMLYPKFKLDTWDKIKDIREIIKSTIDILSEATSVAQIFIDKEKKWITKIVYNSVNVLQALLYLSLGGRLPLNSRKLGIETIFKNINDILSLSIDKTNPNLAFLKKLNINNDSFKADNNLDKEALKSFLAIFKDILWYGFDSAIKLHADKVNETFIINEIKEEKITFFSFLTWIRKTIINNTNNIVNILLLVFGKDDENRTNGQEPQASTNSGKRTPYRHEKTLLKEIFSSSGIFISTLDLIIQITQAVTDSRITKAEVITTVANITEKIVKSSANLYKTIKEIGDDKSKEKEEDKKKEEEKKKEEKQKKK